VSKDHCSQVLDCYVEQLGITTSSVARQEQGVIGISGSTAKLARLLLELAEKAQAVEKKAKRSKKK